MTAADSILALTRDARLLPFATSGIGAWLWASDATRIIWANASGAAVLGAETPAALTARRFGPEEPVAQDVARIAASLPSTGAARLERVRGTGSSLVSTCSRVSLPGDAFGILVIAAEPVAPDDHAISAIAGAIAAAAEPPGQEPQAQGTAGRAALTERRAPLRFVWTMDASLHFTLASPEFADRMGPRTLEMIGRPWR